MITLFRKFSAAIAACLMLLPYAAVAQSNPHLYTGQVPSATQWNSYFSGKLDYNPAGCPISSGCTGATTAAGALTNLGETKAAHFVWIGPNSGSPAAPTWRLLTTADLPGSGLVTSVGLALPAIFNVSGSPVTGVGTLTGALANENANLIWAGPSSGSPATPTFRALVSTDMPGSGAGSGTVTSVALTAPAEFTVGGSPVTSTGTLAVTKANESANTIWAGPTSGGAAAPTFRAQVAADVPSNIRVRSFGASFGDTTGSALTSGGVVYFTVPYACTISAWNITVDAGTVTFDVWKITTGTAVPTVTNTITAAALPALSTGTAKHSTTLTGWTTAVSANDIIGIQLNTVATAKYAEFDGECDQ